MQSFVVGWYRPGGRITGEELADSVLAYVDAVLIAR